MTQVDRNRIEQAWRGRISGCMLGKPIERMSMRGGFDNLQTFLNRVGALPLRDYVPFEEGAGLHQPCCRGHITRSEPDDDIHYSVLSLLMLERHGAELTTADVARTWLNRLPIAFVFTAERSAYITLANEMDMAFAFGGEPTFDLAKCSDNPYNDWIGAQIRTDVYGWVNPGNPDLAARLARADAQLSHRGAGVDGAVFVAACGAAIPVANNLTDAVHRATEELATEEAIEAVRFGESLVGRDDAPAALHERYGGLSPVHTLNNLALVVWALLSFESDYGAAIGEAVAAGWDTDCNGATVGGLWGLAGDVPSAWTDPWNDTVGLSIAGMSEVSLAELVERTVAVADALAGQ